MGWFGQRRHCHAEIGPGDRADLSPAIIARTGDTVDRTLHRHAEDAVIADHQRIVPRTGEVGCIGPFPQFIRILPAHADRFAGAGDGAHHGERADEVDLTPRRPAIGAASGGDRREGEDIQILIARGGRGGGVVHPPVYAPGGGL